MSAPTFESSADPSLAGLHESSRARTDDFLIKLERGMREIERLIEENDGLYPRNNGVVDQKELCKVAKVGESTLRAPKHTQSVNSELSTKQKVKNWLKGLERPGLSVSSRGAVREVLSSQTKTWEEKYKQTMNEYHLAKLQQAQDREALANALRQVDEIRATRDALLSANDQLKRKNDELVRRLAEVQTRIAGTNVTQLRPSPSEGD